MMALKISVRNVLRNRRRSSMTAAAIALGTAAVLLLGALMTYIILDFQTATVRRTGHLAIFKKGYFQFGSGNPVAYGISGYSSVIDRVLRDSELAPMVTVATPMQTVFGIAGNYEANASKTFMGQGIVPADRVRMRQWNAYGLESSTGTKPPLQADDGGIIGLGLARMLGMCEELSVSDCPRRPGAVAGNDQAVGEFDELIRRESQANNATPRQARRIDLLAATAQGAPNVVSLQVERAEFQGVKDLDDAYVIMQLPLAQRLLYGRGEPKVTGILLQLRQTDQIASARARLAALFSQEQLDLEVRDFAELTPFYKQALAFFTFIFTFVALVIGVIVLFTILNTMSMAVMERTSEIGTSRALGVQRSTLQAQFVLEGTLLGMAGATLGVLLAGVIVTVINHSGVTWTPPASAGAIPLQLYLLRNSTLVAGAWISLVAIAAGAAVWPAYRAARLPVVDALRHV
ncbi:ABC transporter permease [Pseudorhodoferax sp. Leaf274]|uniref:ABC transporter permease n=1 Tax=Pseudorhodoferax sp. Leaf274 TaxID=1736318 RepID=UPI0007025CE5|nr:FtsX-like permease family protein [Pseudorhodoferax sp. Leaf274]KQP41140.1 hypothetical protein ASF44_30310 [Pseudorhodoferax sp. Leaf274]